MTTLEELNELKKRIVELETRLEKEKDNVHLFSITDNNSYADVFEFRYDMSFDEMVSHQYPVGGEDHLIFKSKQDGQKFLSIAREILVLAKIAVEINGNWEPDWESSKYKYLITKDSNKEILILERQSIIDFSVFFPTKQHAIRAVKKMQNLGYWEGYTLQEN